MRGTFFAKDSWNVPKIMQFSWDHIQFLKMHEKWNPFHGRFRPKTATNIQLNCLCDENLKNTLKLSCFVVKRNTYLFPMLYVVYTLSIFFTVPDRAEKSNDEPLLFSQNEAEKVKRNALSFRHLIFLMLLRISRIFYSWM